MTFIITSKDVLARTGKLILKHGTVETPAFVPVATRGGIKMLDTYDIEELGAQILMLNTYHLYLRPGIEKIKQFGGLHKFINWKGPIMTDSGGFQAFSLGIGSEMGRSKFKYNQDDEEQKSMDGQIKKYSRHAWVDDDGVTFKSVYDGSKHKLTPEKSIKIDEEL